MAMLQAEHISKSFGKTQVLRDIDFSMEKGLTPGVNSCIL